MSKVIVKDIWAEDLFMWFAEHIAESCGDGTAAIVCKNYEEVSKWFLDWYFDNYGRNLLDYRTVTTTKDSINFHDSNENYIFTSNKDIILHRGDYVFVVEEDCRFAHDTTTERKVLA